MTAEHRLTRRLSCRTLMSRGLLTQPARHAGFAGRIRSLAWTLGGELDKEFVAKTTAPRFAVWI
jgi:hypothetical protein